MSRRRSSARASENGRYALFVVFFAAIFAVIAARLVWIQAVKADDLARQALHQRLRDIELPPRRGTIYDREGEPLAVSVEAKTVFVSPRLVKEPERSAKRIARVLGGKAEDYLPKLTSTRGFEYLSRKVDMDRATELEALEIPGIGFFDDYRRVYPSGPLAAHVLGFVGLEGNGLEGVEFYYDELLRGVPGVSFAESTPSQRPIPGGLNKTIEPTHGTDIVLSIDKDIQFEAQAQLAGLVKEFNAKSASVLIMNPRDGEIYAMASAPGFDPNNHAKAKKDNLRNRVVCDPYEPGSTMKSLTVSAVLDAGECSTKEKLDLPPTIRIGGRTIGESHPVGFRRMTPGEIIADSSNVGTVKLAQRLGEEGLYTGLSRFGLNEKTAIDYPGEVSGWLPSTKYWSASSIGNIPFGQGVSVTPLQLSRAVAGIANEGIMPAPHLLIDVPGGAQEAGPWRGKRAVSAQTAKRMNKMLQGVVTDGTGGAAAVEGYAVAGKTGTAQKALPNGGGYKGGGYVGSFIGYLPADNPQVLICVVVDEPRGNGYYGSVVAAPTFAKLARFTVEHLGIPPSSDHTPASEDSEKDAAGRRSAD